MPKVTQGGQLPDSTGEEGAHSLTPRNLRLLKQEEQKTIKKKKRSMVTQKQQTESEPVALSSPHKHLLLSPTMCVSTVERRFVRPETSDKGLGQPA